MSRGTAGAPGLGFSGVGFWLAMLILFVVPDFVIEAWRKSRMQ